MKTRNTTFIDVGLVDRSRPAERSPKSNLKVELLTASLRVMQHISPERVASVVWRYFTKPGKTQYTKSQEVLLGRAEIGHTSYRGHELVTYRWGHHGPKVLLCHGWNSKIADFRMLIERLVDYGYVVVGVDWKAHGQSQGSHTALPEMRDILKSFYVQEGPFDAVIGYSIGGLAAGVTLSEISQDLLPKQLFLFATPPYTRYFFRDTIRKIGLKKKVYEAMAGLVERYYQQPIDYFDLRTKGAHFDNMEVHLIYDDQDDVVTFEKSADLVKALPNANFVHTRGLGHYKIIAHDETVAYVARKLETSRELAMAPVA